jgi:hypothetical protein
MDSALCSQLQHNDNEIISHCGGSDSSPGQALWDFSGQSGSGGGFL